MPWSSGTYKKGNFSTGGWQGDAALEIGIEAGRHDDQDSDFQDGINACINKNGENSPTANLPMNGKKHTNVADAAANNEYASYGQLVALVPAGSIQMYGGAAAPTGWLLCDGSTVSRAAYSTLFSAIGVAYGAGDGSTTFKLPDLRQRFPLGKAASGTGATLGATGGAIDHDHSVAAHYHSMTGAGSSLATNIGHTHGSSAVSGTIGGASDGTHQHNPSLTVQRGGTPGTGTRVAATNATSDPSNAFPLNWSDGGGHSHTHSLTAAGQSLGTTNVAATGSIGTVTGGSNGDAGFNTGTNNPPYQTVNFIIKT